MEGGALGDGAEVGGRGEGELLGEETELGLSSANSCFSFFSQDLISTREVATLRVIILRKTQITALKKDFLFETPTTIPQEHILDSRFSRLCDTPSC